MNNAANRDKANPFGCHDKNDTNQDKSRRIWIALALELKDRLLLVDWMILPSLRYCSRLYLHLRSHVLSLGYVTDPTEFDC